MSLLICFCAAWPGSGKVSHLSETTRARASSVGKKTQFPSHCFQEQNCTCSLSSHNSQPLRNLSHESRVAESFHVLPPPTALHLLIAKNGNGLRAAEGGHHHLALSNNGSFNQGGGPGATHRLSSPAGSLFPSGWGLKCQAGAGGRSATHGTRCIKTHSGRRRRGGRRRAPAGKQDDEHTPGSA